MKVVCFGGESYQRARHIAKAMAEGLKRHGITVRYAEKVDFAGDLIIAYGWRHRGLFDTYKSTGRHFVYLDLGFWQRKGAGVPRLEGYHKVAVDDWSPTPKMRRNCPADRLGRLGLTLAPWRPANPAKAVLVAGMSEKSARGHGLEPEAWERAAVATLRQITARPIIYRPKPSWPNAKPIDGAQLSIGAETLESVLARTHMVVTHHSNVGIDALVAGIPVYCETGAPALLSCAAIADIETPRIPSDQERKQLLADLAYAQWTPAEMRSGACWDHIKGLI